MTSCLSVPFGAFLFLACESIFVFWRCCLADVPEDRPADEGFYGKDFTKAVPNVLMCDFLFLPLFPADSQDPANCLVDKYLKAF